MKEIKDMDVTELVEESRRIKSEMRVASAMQKAMEFELAAVTRKLTALQGSN